MEKQMLDGLQLLQSIGKTPLIVSRMLGRHHVAQNEI